MSNRVCLNMIVKDEAAVIERCLESAKDYIDCYVIADTGSSDNTKALIEKTLGGLPGRVFSEPWVNFAHNRSEVFEESLGFADWHLVIDADETLDLGGLSGPDFKKLLEKHNQNQHLLGRCVYPSSGFEFDRPALFHDSREWRYEGVVHNYAKAKRSSTPVKAPWMRIIHHSDGATWSDTKKKYLRNAELLIAELAKNPKDTRSQFYLGESYRDAGVRGEALAAYRARVKMGGWEEEVYWSLYQIARLTGKTDDYLDAFAFRPSRAEALYELGVKLRIAKKYPLAELILMAVPMDIPSDILFVDYSVHNWKLHDQLALTWYQMGKNVPEMVEFGQHAIEHAPEAQKPRLMKNQLFYLKRAESLT